MSETVSHTEPGDQTTASKAEGNAHLSSPDAIPRSRRVIYTAITCLLVPVILLGVEVTTRLTLPHVSSLELFVNAAQQKAQVANQQQGVIFEGDPLLLW